MVLTILLLLLATILAAPDTQIGRFLHHFMVARPAAALSRLTVAHILRAATLVLTIAVIFWLMQHDGLQFLAGAAPEAVSWMLAFDVSTFLEAAAVVAFIASAVRFRAIRARLQTILQRHPARTGRREQHSRGASSPRRPHADNDNEADSRRRAA